MNPKKVFFYAIAPISLFELSSIAGKPTNYNELGYEQDGVASYYATEFHGRATASGEPYDMYAGTAAHKKLQFNSLVEVTNLKNGKRTVVRINDRGPYVAGRIIDLSVTAAKELDMIRDGISQVSIRVLRVGATGEMLDERDNLPQEQAVYEKGRKKVTVRRVNEKRKVLRTQSYSIWGTEKFPEEYGSQLGSYGDLSNAVKKGKEAYLKGFKEVYIQASYDRNQNRIFRVIVGDGTPQEAQKLTEALKRNGFSEAFPKAHFNHGY
ncbi:MAG: septal ring lytic transglycosylase RlpA family protein [Bernardetiaceae bacterium]|nr:septal ring lytic transglycosylase RlpA family protein [Bernardetiaceae bacterium]